MLSVGLCRCLWCAVVGDVDRKQALGGAASRTNHHQKDACWHPIEVAKQCFQTLQGRSISLSKAADCIASFGGWRSLQSSRCNIYYSSNVLVHCIPITPKGMHRCIVSGKMHPYNTSHEVRLESIDMFFSKFEISWKLRSSISLSGIPQSSIPYPKEARNGAFVVSPFYPAFCVCILGCAPGLLSLEKPRWKSKPFCQDVLLVQDLAQQCMHPDSHQRPTFSQALDELEPMREMAEKGTLLAYKPESEAMSTVVGQISAIQEGEETQHSSKDWSTQRHLAVCNVPMRANMWSH